jgi:hypothetical protein
LVIVPAHVPRPQVRMTADPAYAGREILQQPALRRSPPLAARLHRSVGLGGVDRAMPLLGLAPRLAGGFLEGLAQLRL